MEDNCLLLFLTSSMVIRDLTLRSAASFGSFHLIRLLYDEYMYYLIEHRVAQAKGETPIAVMGEVPKRFTHTDKLNVVSFLHNNNTFLSCHQFASLGRGLHQLDPDKGNHPFGLFAPDAILALSATNPFPPVSTAEEEEEEDDESDDEGQELSLPSDGGVLGDESLEPPAKLARMDQRVLFATGSADN